MDPTSLPSMLKNVLRPDSARPFTTPRPPSPGMLGTPPPLSPDTGDTGDTEGQAGQAEKKQDPRHEGQGVSALFCEERRPLAPGSQLDVCETEVMVECDVRRFQSVR